MYLIHYFFPGLKKNFYVVLYWLYILLDKTNITSIIYLVVFILVIG